MLIAALVAAAATSACSPGQGACAASRAELPATARPGTTVTVKLSELWSSCADQGQGASSRLSRVEIRAVASKDPNQVVATASAEVGEDATAVVALPLPADATGVLSIQLGGQTVGELTIATDA
jgi:hypothetical protein